LTGLNSRIDELQAAFLRVKLRHLDQWNARRKSLASLYLSQLSSLSPQLVLPFVPDWADPVWHLFVIRHPKRDALQEKLSNDGIQTVIHYPVPPHLSGAYAGMGFKRGDFPIAEKLAGEVLSLPIGPHLPSGSIEAVCRAVGSGPEER
jgi:dTDP-4-amino-4,6-dideoxygalactose transaminase